MSYVSIRGAITVEENTKEEILNNTHILLKEIVEQNNVSIRDILNIIFTATKDLNSVYPAEAARKLGITNAALICLQEMEVEGSIEKCLRILLTAQLDINQDKVKHIYLKKAAILRPDLV